MGILDVDANIALQGTQEIPYNREAIAKKVNLKLKKKKNDLTLGLI